MRIYAQLSKTLMDSELERLKTENERLNAENEQLKTENERLQAESIRTNAIIRRAKDPDPVQRPSLKRVLKLVSEACMNLSRVPGGWLLKLGSLARRFRKLSQIWEILLQDDWVLSEVFTEPVKVRSRSIPVPRLLPRNPSIAPAATPVLAIPFCDSD